MGMSFSYRALITPMWAMPFDPPPLSTRPTDWLSAEACAGVYAMAIAAAAAAANIRLIG